MLKYFQNKCFTQCFTQDRYTTDCTVPKSILFYALCKMSNVFIGPSHSLRFMALVLASLLLKTDFMKLVT